MGSVPDREPEDHRHARRRSTTRRTRTTCPTRWRTRRSSGCTRSVGRIAKKPFFAYFSTGCSHAPHHVSEQWAAKYKGKFDQGWDKLREETFARQKKLGVIPADAELTPRDEALPAWDDLPDKLKAFYARQMEVYAGYSENADHNVGRVIDAIEELGELDNTLVLWIWGDNGASLEGTITGSFNELTMQNGIPLTRRDAAPARRALRGQRGLGRSDDGSPLLGGLGVGRQHAVQVGQAGRLAPRRHAQPARRPLARADQRCGGAADALHPRDRRRADDPRHRRHPDADAHRRDRAAADARRDVRRLADRRRRARAPHPAVLRDDRQPRDVQGRLVAVDEDRADPVGPDAGRAEAVRPRRVGPGCRSRRALLPARRLHAGQGSRRRASREGPGAQGAVLAGGREVQGPPADGAARRVLRHRPAAAGDRAATSSAATCRTSCRG